MGSGAEASNLIAGWADARAAGFRALVVLLLVAWCGPALAELVGLPVQEVLRQLGGDGINFIYNTELIPSGMVVEREPVASGAVDVAREILAQHGLSLEAVGDNAYAVVRDSRQGRPAAAPAQGDPRGAAATPEIAEIVVTTSRYALGYADPQPHLVLDHADVQAMPSMGDEPLRTVQRLPGSTAYGVSAQTHIRGGEVDEVLMVLDGLPLHQPFHLRNFLAPVSVIDAAAIESIDVSSGGFTANFGDRMSGVIDIDLLDAPADRYTELGLSLYHASGLSAGRFDEGRGRWLAAARRSNLDLVAKAVDWDYGEPEYYDVFAHGSYALSDATTLFGSALRAKDEVHAKDDDSRVEADYLNTYVWGGWDQLWPARFSSRLILAVTDVDNERQGTLDEAGESSGGVDDDRTLQSYLARLEVSHDAGRFYTRTGVEGRHLHAEYRYRSTVTYAPDYPLPGDPQTTATRDLSPRPDGNQLAAWVTSRVRVTDRLTSELGLRWDDQTYDDVGGPEQISPRLNLLYDLAPGTRLRAAWGRFWQAQGADELQVEDGIGTFYEPQRVDHLILSLERALPSDLDLRIEAYQKDYDEVRPHFENLFDPVRLMPELEPDRIEVAPDHSRARGVEITLTRRSDGPWSGWLSYVWSRVTDRIEGDDVVRSWDQRHAIGAGLRYVSGPWEATLTHTYHTGWPTTDVFLTPDPAGGPDVATVGPRNAARYRPYNSFDFRVIRSYFLADSELEAFFELNNALARRNECCTDYDVTAPGGVTVIDRDVKNWPRLVPNFGVVWKF
jgi:outer membrane receptor protein involved in Fe transport